MLLSTKHKLLIIADNFYLLEVVSCGWSVGNHRPPFCLSIDIFFANSLTLAQACRPTQIMFPHRSHYCEQDVSCSPSDRKRGGRNQAAICFFAFNGVSNLVGPTQTNPCWQLPMPSIGSPLPYLRCPVSLWLALVQLAKAQSTKWANKMAQMKQRQLGGGA